MLELKNLTVHVGENTVLHDVSVRFESGETVYIVGKNGGGKSSLLMSVMGYPKYRIESGDILLDGESLIGMNITERARNGIFLALQNIPEIPGVRLLEFLRTIYNEKLSWSGSEVKPLTPFMFRKFIAQKFQKFGIPESFLDRDLNVGFSWGEKRRIEMLQIELLEPRCILVDEIDAGLDVEAFKSVSESLAELVSPERTIVVVTHNYRLTKHLPPNRVVLMDGGRLGRIGDASLLSEVESDGFSSIAIH